MAQRTLELTLISAKDLKDVNLLSKMEVYAVVSLSGDRRSRQRIATDRAGGRNPAWNAAPLRFTVPASGAGSLHVLLRAERALGDRDVGEVFVPVADLQLAAAAHYQYLVHKVQSTTEHCGVLSLSYRLGPVVVPAPPLAADTGAVPAYLVVPCYANAPPYVYLSPANPARGEAASASPSPPPRRKRSGDFGQWLGGAVRGMLSGEAMSPDTAAYDAGYKTLIGVADGRRVKF